MPGTPFTFATGTVTSGTAVFSVTTATAAGDALVVAATSAGTGFPSVTSVTDTQGNTYNLKQSFSSAGPGFWVYAATGNTKALSTSDTVTVSFSGALVSGTAVICTDCPGVSVIDVSVIATGTSVTAAASGTTAQPGETALVMIGWANAGGVGSMSAPFTQLTQQHLSATSGGYCTSGYDLVTARGAPLTASDTIASAAWRAVLVTFLGGVPPVQLPPLPRRKPARAFIQFAPVRTVNAAPPPPVNGTVQPLATIPVARRRPARAYVRFTPVPGGLPPNGTVQPRATVPVPRRTRTRAFIQFTPVRMTNAPPPPVFPPIIPTSGGDRDVAIRVFRSLAPGDVPAAGAQLPRLQGRAFLVPIPVDTEHASHPWPEAPPGPTAAEQVIAAAGEVLEQAAAAGGRIVEAGRIFADPPYERQPKTCGAIRRIGGVTLTCKRKPHSTGKHHDRGLDWSLWPHRCLRLSGL